MASRKARDRAIEAATRIVGSSPWVSRAPVLMGNCVIREHTGDGAYVGRCDFAIHDGVCPRHGKVEDYPNNDDREVAVVNRRFA